MLQFKAWMVANGVKQTEIAELLCISLQAVNEKVNGKKDFTMPQVRTICKAYNISADLFLTES